jgi:hypothetical protein
MDERYPHFCTERAHRMTLTCAPVGMGDARTAVSINYRRKRTRRPYGGPLHYREPVSGRTGTCQDV